ncbi:deoxyuridine 5'-triphosphate nucleotidohydrolase [Methanosarcinales archaeon]|nr:MAG: deoxyuridine 5'-triphosphate nucleotidohydrolase [Methanosarcinales archaeon]
MLGRSEIKKLIDAGLVEGAPDIESQLQPNGLELTLKDVEVFDGAGKLGVDDREIAKSEPLDFDENGWLFLPPGAYKLRFNEIVKLPVEYGALAKPRSTLLRCGVTIHTAVWDAGYRGRGECLMVVYNTKGFWIRKGARILQLVFFRLIGESGRGYEGVFQNENL